MEDCDDLCECLEAAEVVRECAVGALTKPVEAALTEARLFEDTAVDDFGARGFEDRLDVDLTRVATGLTAPSLAPSFPRMSLFCCRMR